VLFDTLTDVHLITIGDAIWKSPLNEGKTLFVAGSSGIESALITRWGAAGNELPAIAPARGPVLVVSGSCSPVTGRQIAWALANGFAEVPLDTRQLMQNSTHEAAISEAIKRVTTELAAGRSVIVRTSRGPDGDRITTAKQSAPPGLNTGSLGAILGRILGEVLLSRLVERVAVAGGDTSGAVAREIGIDALEMVGPLAPGAPLCIAHSRREAVKGIEFTFKGGQVGHDDFFGTLLRGGPNR
jgi:uncharacterized protein YgbK (DUF1537 family)